MKVRSKSRHLVVASGISQFIVAATFILAARRLGPVEFGTAAAIMAFCSTAANFVNFGANNYLIREMAAGRAQPSEYASRLVSKVVAASAAAAVLWVAVSLTTTSVTQGAVASLLVLALTVNQMLFVPFYRDRRFAALGTAIVVDKTLALVACLLLTRVFGSVDSFLLGLVLGPLVSSALLVQRLPLEVKSSLRKQLREFRLTNPWSGSFHFGVSSAAASIQPLDVSILGMIAGPSAAGGYAAVNRWTQPAVLLANSYVQTLLAGWSKAASSNLDLRLFFKQVMPLTFFVFPCAILWLFSEFFVTTLLGENFQDASPVLRVLALALPIVAINQAGFSLMLARNKDRMASTSIWIALIVQFGVLAAMAPLLGSSAASIGYLSGQLALAAIWLAWILCRENNPTRLRSGSADLEGD